MNWKASITRTGESEPSWAGYFELESEANEWLDKQKLKPGRRPERVVQEPVLDAEGYEQHNDVPRVDELGNPVYRVEYQYDENGEVVEGSGVVTDEQIIDQVLITEEVTYPAEASYEVLDNSEEANRESRLKQLQLDVMKNKADLDFGMMVIALVGMKNEVKGLTHDQKNSMMADSDIQTILAMLQAGRIGYSKQLVTAYTPDGTLLTQADKDDILQLIEDHLAKWS